MSGDAMNAPQRIVLIGYCILVTYCCLWVPWRVEYNPVSEYARVRYMREGYGWLWAGPRILVERRPEVAPSSAGGWTVVGEEDAPSTKQAVKPPAAGVLQPGLIYAEPDSRVIVLRLIAATAVSGVAFLAAGFLARSKALS
jgi:hypothetical protein